MATSYQIVITYTDITGQNGHPETWDWWEQLSITGDEILSVVEVSEILLPADHAEELTQMQDPEYLAALNDLEERP